ncbi:hypothetical protein GC105_09425 [Alkalibaculum sp. M08DMB]|uniref:YIEGIA protein n=1 Tax=Alkalibaculum sporogenes TaxID=2655001 RepID=A0A6A7K990_9FIRM|nr:YIEGIA family protein [Alkalibaculum sporogenes]MPW26010.1 hypothetical protein [Alkalibaculum sporogenes]
MENTNLLIFTSIIMGTFARIFMIRIDYRQYPSYPQSFVSHLILGFVAACLGSVVIPAFVSQDYSAVTFLALATSQFKDIRNMERQSLENLEDTELVMRGMAYIEDISKRFEARNYVAFITALFVCGISIVISNFFTLYLQIALSVVGGFCIILFLNKLMKADTIIDIAEVKEATINFKGPLMCVDDVVIMNIGHNVSKEILIEKAVAIMLYPNDVNSVATLANIGQRQAILHNLATQLGIRKDVDEPDFTPLARREPETGNIAIVVLAMNNNIDDMISATKKVPVLESSRRKPKKTS